MQSAGGVGGLLQAKLIDAANALCLPCYDGNGNIMAWVDGANSALIERREYDSFGSMVSIYRLATNATLHGRLAYGFSTKWRDAESDLLYYGHRYYNPSTQRWLNRDLIEEAGGINLYGFVGNDGVNYTDLLGMQVWARLTINEDKHYQVDMFFRYKICVCDKDNNRDLAILDEDSVAKWSERVENSIKSFWKEQEPFLDKIGTLRIWSKNIGEKNGKCDKYSEEIKAATSDPYYNIIYIYPAATGYGDVGGEIIQNVMRIAENKNDRTLGHELGHMIGYEHPSESSVFDNDIMKQVDGDKKVGSDSSLNYMNSIYKYMLKNRSDALIDSNVIMRNDQFKF